MTTYQRTRRDAKRASRECRKGDVLWVKHDVATNIAPYEDNQLLGEYTVTHDHPILGGAMISGALSVEDLVLRDGPVYTRRPAGMRAVHEPAPQVSGPLGQRTNRRLNAAEIRELEGQVEAALAKRHGQRKAERLVAKARRNPDKLMELVS